MGKLLPTIFMGQFSRAK